MKYWKVVTEFSYHNGDTKEEIEKLFIGGCGFTPESVELLEDSEETK